MGSELYLDLVSKTIISMLSKEIAVDVGAQVGQRVNELLNSSLAGIISEQLSSQTDRLGRSISELEGTLKPQISALGAQITQMSAQIIEKSGLTGEIGAIKTALENGQESHKDVMSGIVSIKEGLNEALQKNLGTQIAGVSEKIETAFSDMDTRMSAIAESTAKLAGQSNLDMLKKVLDGIGRQAAEAAAASDAIKKDVSAINEALQKNLGTQIAGVSEKIETAFSDMDTRMSAIAESTAKLAGQSNLDMLKKVLDGIGRQADESAASSEAIKKDLSDISATLQKNLIGQIEGISEKIDESVRLALQSSAKEEGEMAKGAYYAVKKLVSDFNKAKEDAIVFNKQYMNGLTDLRTHFEDDLGKRLMGAEEQSAAIKDDIQNLHKGLQHNVKDQNKLLLDIVGTIERQLPFFSGKVDDAISGIEGKVAGFERSTLSKIDRAGSDIMKYIDENVANNLKDTEKGYAPLFDELNAVKQLISGIVKDQSDVLQGVFLSVKKLLNISAKERDTNEKVSKELTNALDNLYSHIRRLEAENDELDVELLRLAGDDYFKNKFKQLENELVKARGLADKYKDEKAELEQRYDMLQQQWSLARELEGK
ncbi:MAG: hypothetical protein L7F77_09715 [Candidatus Magnetominusculus sp. LBB02]|nr:hypothetical protein [Candidatus Magnetominusculus sp. LBB02]